MTTKIALLACLFAAAPTPASYKLGDVMVVIQNADLTADDKTIDSVFPGVTFVVQKIDGEKLWISNGKPGWLESKNAVTLDEGLSHFNDLIRKEPKDPRHLSARANIFRAKEEYDLAIADYNEAIKLNPEWDGYYARRATLHMLKRDHDKAIADFTAAIKIQPRAITYDGRGNAFANKGDYVSALADHNISARLDPALSAPLANLAEIYACCPDSLFRDGDKALELAKKACEMSQWLDAEKLHFLACANAETGNFADAVRWEAKALELNPPSKRQNRKAYEKALELFQAEMPLHEITQLE